MKYKVTHELRTSKWKKFLRWIRLAKKREEYYLILNSDCFFEGSLVANGEGNIILIVGKE